MITLPTPPDALLLKADNTTEVIRPKNGTDFQLEELYEILHCDMIEVARSQACIQQGKKNKDYILIIDEEGKLKNHRFNARATEWFSAPNDYIVNDAIFCHSAMLK